MAVFIDEYIFSKIPQNKQQLEESLDPKYVIEEMSKCSNLSTDIYKRTRSHCSSEIFLSTKLAQSEYIIRLSALRSCNYLAIEMRDITKQSFTKIKSKEMEILLLKDITRLRYKNNTESAYFINKAAIVMTIKLFLSANHAHKKFWIEYYNKVLIKNVLQFHQFLEQTFSVTQSSFKQYETMSQFQQELQISQIISTVPSNFQISEETSHFKTAQEAIKTQKDKLKEIRCSIVNQAWLEKNNHRLFQNIKNQSTSSWMSYSIISTFEKLQPKGAKIIKIPKSGQRKIQDYLFNIVKMDIKEKISRPIGEGGSSYIQLAKVLIAYINSVDYSAYKVNEEKLEKLVVIKSLKPEFEKKLRHKIVHEKQIVSKLKGSCSTFIPKYYGTERGSDLNNVLVMEHLQGQELDRYLYYRSDTISLWTKICILINIVQGIRHLINYDIIHLDIKPINILVCRNLIPKIIDYGEAYNKDICPENYCPGYTFPYAAPEVYERYSEQASGKGGKNLAFSQKQDVFGFGMIMYQVLFNSKVFSCSIDKLKQVYYEKKIYQNIHAAFEMMENYGKSNIIYPLLNIAMKCLNDDPAKRPKFDWIGVSLKLILNSYTNH